ncbi:hypothetical protein CEXT_557701 [Caerostris extrusa]|uniref:Uncharacterized protein n=1 Tax=Caerostris extrusa TaxID=172846 RepID=A0AAV4W9K2_CAEEX|nr:hypothetical protein CEXT_557701 [Caerostris extrusa]
MLHEQQYTHNRRKKRSTFQRHAQIFGKLHKNKSKQKNSQKRANNGNRFEVGRRRFLASIKRLEQIVAFLAGYIRRLAADGGNR